MPVSDGLRNCIRRGCGQRVKKPTAKYCSVRCCSVDPERRERLRHQRGRTSDGAVLQFSRQLSLTLAASSAEEAQLVALCEGREDAPNALSWWTG